MTDLPRLMRRDQAPRTGIVHLGPGAFFRAFNAIYTHEAMQAAGGDWGITAVSLRSPNARDQLAPQGGVYAAVSLTPDGGDPHVIGSVVSLLVAPEDPASVVAAMADPNVKIVSLTVTEKGYCHEPATGRLNLNHADIAHDLAHPDAPRSAPGFIVAALAKRRQDGRPAFTVLSCDNLPSNGALARRVVLDFAQARDPALADWIASEAKFPSTMVDRITPATTPEDIDRLANAEGYHDPGCVIHEPFRQWVIKDDFACGRPAWDRVGAQFVKSVDAHETMKLRCLNGTHSTLAYLGYLAGFETIAQATADPDFATFCERLWKDEILPTLRAPDGENLTAYCDNLLTRYRNPSIRHRTWQIAMDGSQKLPQRILGTISDRLSVGEVPHGLCLTVAAWMRYVGGVDEAGRAIDVRDPLAQKLRALSDAGIGDEGKVSKLLSVREVFTLDLAQNLAFKSAVVTAYTSLRKNGAKSSVAAYLA